MDNTQVPEQIVAGEADRPALAAIKRLLAEQDKDGDGCGLKLIGVQGEPVVLPPAIRQGLAQLVTYLAHDQSVILVPMDKELTTQQAADLLNVSRPFLIKLLEQGAIPFVRTGTHRRIRFADLLVYKQHRNTNQRELLKELTQLSEDLGLYDAS